jgi:apolipoprotein N-acyltransferase
MTKNLAWLLSAVLLGLSYPSFDPIPTGVLAWFAFVPFLVENKNQKPFLSYLLQASLMIILAILIDVYWLNYYSFKAYLFCVFSQFYFLVFPLIIHYFFQKRFGFKTALFLLPFVWTITDFLAHIAPHGMQVYLLPYTQANNTWLVQFIDLTGMWGITFLVISFNSLLAYAFSNSFVQDIPPAPLQRGISTNPISTLKGDKEIFLEYEFEKGKQVKKLPLWGFGGFLFLCLSYSFFILKINPKSAIGSLARTSKVSIIQTNQDSYSTDSAIVQKSFDEIVSLSDSAVRTAQPDLLVLPEGAIPIPLFQDKNLLNFTKKAISNWQTSVAIGYVEYPDATKKYIFRNNALVFTPQLAMFWDSLKIKPQNVKVYQKRYGLPFVELMPYFESTPTARGSAMERGTEPYTFDYANFNGDKFKVALTICWEQMYPHRMAELVNDGAEFVALMNNDAWFGTSGGGKQLLSYTRLRAIENRRSVVRCSNGGISCFIDPFGNISERLPWFTSAIGTQEVLCVSKKTFSTQHPAWFPKFCGVILLLILGVLFFKNQK